MQERVEIRDGRPFVVKVLPEAKPPKNRSQVTRFHLAAGNVGEGMKNRKRGKRKKKRPG